LDDIADIIWGSAKRIIIYDMVDVDDATKAFSVIIKKSITELHKCIGELRSMKKIKSIIESTIKINSYENEGDDLLSKSLVEMFNSEKDAIEIIKKKDLYQMLEIVTDKCEDAANVIESIIVKYA
jgi:uncharacterized protein Yka (UPF0111/DUF47 family)